MNIGVIGSASAFQPIQRTPEAAEVKGSPENDGDRDDGGVTQLAPSATVNASGQKIGQLLNAIA